MLYRMLGPLEVQVDGAWRGISAAKWRTVLAVLLVNSGQVVSTDELIGEVWPEEAPATAVNLVSVYVHRLRRQLPDGSRRLVTRSPGYQLLATPDNIDVGQFDRMMRDGRAALAAREPERAAGLLNAAEALWHGTRAFADVPPSPLITAEAGRLEDCRVEALELRIQADLGCGRHAQVVPELRRLLADHPLREGMWALLMRALQRSGRQAEALEAYAHARQQIADELGVDPSAELRQLYEQILRADAGADPAFLPTPPAADSPFADASPSPLVTPAAAGQEGEPARPGQPPGPPAAAADPAAAPAPESPDGHARAGQPESPALPRLAQLPADIPDFTGRAEHLRDLHELLSGPRRPDSPGAVVVAAVIGAGGLGKTTLAVHAAHLLRAQYPDGQLYANLQGASARPAAPGEVLARFLRDLGMDPARIPADPEERAAQYRTRLTDRRVLVVLDDAPDAAHVRPLLPGSASCAVLVTTRNRMPDLAGSRFVDLDVLQPGEARDMFTGIIGPIRAGAEPEATAEVLAACAGLPLAIRIAGARLAARTRWSVRDLARRLSDERRRLDELKTGDLAVRACFEVSFASLPGPAEPDGVDPAQAFRLLGLWQGPSIGLPAAAALLGQPEDQVADALEVLVDAQLLQSPAPDRYRFHDLLRAYAAERALAEESAETRQQAVHRLLDWYLFTSVDMVRVVSPHRNLVRVGAPRAGCHPLQFGTADEALNWCEQERANLVAATLQAADHGLYDVAWKLPVSALSFFNRRTYRAEWITTHQVALASARRVADRVGEAWVLNNLGMAHNQVGQRDAIGYFEQALAIRRELGDAHGEAQAANNLADTYLRLGLFREALGPLRQALELQQRLAYRFGEAVARHNLGEAYLHLDRCSEAIDSFEEARQIFHVLGDAHGEAYAQHYLGRAFLQCGRIEDALGPLNDALRIRRAGGERLAEAHTLWQLGNAQLAAHRADEARQSWARALNLFEALDDLPQADLLRSQMARADAGEGAVTG
jgi:DNA-binding SARP family transcriptional activator